MAAVTFLCESMLRPWGSLLFACTVTVPAGPSMLSTTAKISARSPGRSRRGRFARTVMGRLTVTVVSPYPKREGALFFSVPVEAAAYTEKVVRSSGRDNTVDTRPV